MINLPIYVSQVFRSVLILWGVFLGIFLFYQRGKLLGFNRGKLLDVAVFSSLLAFLTNNLLSNWPKVKVVATFIVFILTSSLLIRREGWSYAKIADISSFCLALALSFFPWPNLFFNLFFILTFLSLRQASGLSPKSGFLFYVFLSGLVFSLFLMSFSVKSRSSSVLWLVLLVFLLLRFKIRSYDTELVRIWRHFFSRFRLLFFSWSTLKVIFFWKKKKEPDPELFDSTSTKAKGKGEN